MIYGYFYRNMMKLAHKYNWHYAPPIYPDGDTQLWCKYCGFRQTIKRKPESLMEMHAKAEVAGITLREYIENNTPKSVN